MIRLPSRPPWLRSVPCYGSPGAVPPTQPIILGLAGLGRGDLATVAAFRSVVLRTGKRDRPDRGRRLRIGRCLRHRHATRRRLAEMPSIPGVGDQEIHVDMVVVIAVAARPEHRIEFRAATAI